MSKKEHISDEEMKREFPILFGQNRGDSFSAPDGYFEKLPSAIMKRIKNETKIIPIQNKNKMRFIAGFASIAAAVIIGIFFIGNDPISVNENEMLVFTTAEISEITEEYIAEIDEEIVFEALLSDDMNEVIENEEYIDYIYENDIDVEEIIYEL